MQGSRFQAITDLAEKGWIVIGLPQSLHYNDNSRGEKESEEWRRAMSNKSLLPKDKIHLTWRQLDSYNRSRSLYPFVSNHLMPDVAFMIGPLPDTNVWSKTKEKYDIIFLKRTDQESIYNYNSSVVQDILRKSNETKMLSFRITDWYGEKFEMFSLDVGQSLQLEFKVS